jgi:hypothetical protein
LDLDSEREMKGGDDIIRDGEFQIRFPHHFGEDSEEGREKERLGVTRAGRHEISTF